MNPNKTSLNRSTTSLNRDIQDEDALKRGFSARFQHVVVKQGLSQASLAKRAGLRPQLVGKYWNGEQLPKPLQLFALADALRVDARWLFTGEEAKNPVASPIANTISSLARELDEAGQHHLYETARLLWDRMTVNRLKEKGHGAEQPTLHDRPLPYRTGDNEG